MMPYSFQRHCSKLDLAVARLWKTYLARFLFSKLYSDHSSLAAGLPATPQYDFLLSYLICWLPLEICSDLTYVADACCIRGCVPDLWLLYYLLNPFPYSPEKKARSRPAFQLLETLPMKSLDLPPTPPVFHSHHPPCHLGSLQSHRRRDRIEIKQVWVDH